jgi:hypothetical protein
VTELVFSDRDAYLAWIEALGVEEVAADEERFLERSLTRAYVIEERLAPMDSGISGAFLAHPGAKNGSLKPNSARSPRSTEPKVRGSNPLGRASSLGSLWAFAGTSSRPPQTPVRRSEARERFWLIFWRLFWRRQQTASMASQLRGRTMIS